MLAKEFCEKHNVTVTYQTAPLRKDDAKGSFRYVVTVNYAGKAHTFDYWKGAGHVGYRKLRSREFKNGEYKEVYEWKMASWEEIKRIQQKIRFGEFSVIGPKLQPIPPQANEVLYALAMDCQCIRDYPLWEDFADAMGYNSDSIKEKKTFDACCENFRKLRDMFGCAILNELMNVEDE